MTRVLLWHAVSAVTLARLRRRDLALAGGGLATAIAGGLLWLRRQSMSGDAGAVHLHGRLGGSLSSVERRLGRTPGGEPPVAVGTSYVRRSYAVPAGRLSIEATPAGQVRQLTLGRDRAVADTWEPDPADWTLERARGLARDWLPGDAGRLYSEPFAFRGAIAGTRDVYRSRSLAGVMGEAEYDAAGGAGPTGVFGVTFYQSSSGGVAFILIGLI